MSNVQLRAVGVHAPGPAFTWGATHAGFQVVANLTQGNLGNNTSIRNFRDTLLFDIREWPLLDLADAEVDLIFSHPAPGGSHEHVCFVAGTPVMTTRGAIPIEQVRRGDLVMTWRNDRFQPVTDLSVRDYTGSLVEVGSSYGTYFTCTPEHPVCVRWSGEPITWLQASKVAGRLGWIPTSLTRSPALTVKSVPPTGSRKVYNLTVESDNCYVAGGLLVHNCDQANHTALTLRPRAFVIEGGIDWQEADSVCGTWEKLWMEAGYHTTRIAVNAAHCGLPQLRRRTLFVAADYPLDFSVFQDQSVAPKAATVEEAIGDLIAEPLASHVEQVRPYSGEPQTAYQAWCRQNSDGVSGHVLSPGTPSLASLIPHIPPGKHVRQIPDAIYEQTYWKERKKTMVRGGKGKPSMFYRRLAWNRPCPHIPGDIRYLHPEFDRFITPRETARLMGWPDTLHFGTGVTAPRANLETGRTISPLIAQRVSALLVECSKASGLVHQSRHDFLRAKK